MLTNDEITTCKGCGYDTITADGDGICDCCAGRCSQCQEVAEEVERVRCEGCKFWYWEEELIEGMCELCYPKSKEIWCDICAGREELELVAAGLDHSVKTCQDCNFELAKEVREQNIGYCGRCQEYGPRVANWQAGALCLECNKLVEL